MAVSEGGVLFLTQIPVKFAPETQQNYLFSKTLDF
jgi:hypothetical protein